MEKPRVISQKDVEAAQDTIKDTGRFVRRDLETHRRAFGLQSFDDFAGKKVLDLGGSFGLTFARELEKAGVDADVVSFSPAFADKATAALTREERTGDKQGKLMVAGMGEELPFAENSFDRIVCLSVAEHLGTRERYIAFLQDVVRALSPGGVAYLSPMIQEIPGGHRVPAGSVILKEELEKVLGEAATVEWNSFDWPNRKGGVDTFSNLTLT